MSLFCSMWQRSLTKPVPVINTTTHRVIIKMSHNPHCYWARIFASGFANHCWILRRMVMCHRLISVYWHTPVLVSVNNHLIPLALTYIFAMPSLIHDPFDLGDCQRKFAAFQCLITVHQLIIIIVCCRNRLVHADILHVHQLVYRVDWWLLLVVPTSK